MKAIVFTVTVEVERVSGKFISRDALADQIEEALNEADYQQWSVDDSEYETSVWDVSRDADG